ncbi:Putative peptidoglycan binding domain-containing protein [Tistlia consotensis]|uniref:Putative peptidoglycan binding domain-containing protein n=1 Tax=Tistlia consotensis USBA 355 TaxID=560819 RepID=A0A1Y6CJ65_9PROT|nr:peptidoglycan-binding protein [Tistlia consotensis]SMF57506.1 Putative peptidoglycan binding domain-containing protein [Tistlia consotensis USBA 355]SNR45819.1 Putative peptidoglycan binding domain-containing protein [Tistlia consotensis]
MTRPLGYLPAAAASFLLIAAACHTPARGAEAGASAARQAQAPGPVTLFQPSSTETRTPVYRTPARQPDRAAATAALPLDRQEAVVRRTQASLAQLGFDPGPVDGRMGPQTRSAIRAFQRAHDRLSDGELDHGLLSDLAAALTEARLKQTGSDRRIADTGPDGAPAAAGKSGDAPGELYSGRAPLAQADSAASPRQPAASAPGGVGLISSAEAATPSPAAPLPATTPAAPTLTATPATTDENYDIGDAIAESWTIITGLSETLLDELADRAAHAVD